MDDPQQQGNIGAPAWRECGTRRPDCPGGIVNWSREFVRWFIKVLLSMGFCGARGADRATLAAPIFCASLQSSTMKTCRRRAVHAKNQGLLDVGHTIAFWRARVAAAQ
jgi:hypothetical protein